MIRRDLYWLLLIRYLCLPHLRCQRPAGTSCETPRIALEGTPSWSAARAPRNAVSKLSTRKKFLTTKLGRDLRSISQYGAKANRVWLCCSDTACAVWLRDYTAIMRHARYYCLVSFRQLMLLPQRRRHLWPFWIFWSPDVHRACRDPHLKQFCNHVSAIHRQGKILYT